MNECLAVMDLGTNTFHLLIVEGDTILVHRQDPVKLGEGGINKGFIAPEAFERGIQTMQQFAGLIKERKATGLRAVATSALRNASNGPDFIRDVNEKTGINIEIIDGEAEAGFIYQGIRAAGCLSSENSLIVDIGGGSVEFILCNDKDIFWKQSFEIGAARLMDRFHHTDPIPPDSINALELYLDDCLQPLFAAAKKHPVKTLAGSSGVFESYAGLIETDKGETFDLEKNIKYSFDREELQALLEKIILSSHQQRLANAGITPVRVDMIVTASLLTRFVIAKLGIDQVEMSTWSLKEGVLAEMKGG